MTITITMTSTSQTSSGTSLLIDGTGQETQFLLAHGAGAPMDHPWMSSVAQRFAASGIEVVRFEFPYMAARRKGGKRPPDRESVLRATWLEVIEHRRDARPLFIGGKSMGGRFATMVADEASVAGVISFGYPFHPPGQRQKLRVEHLLEISTPVLILQGERDQFGASAEVAGYGLKAPVQVHWIIDGDHSLKPRASSGRTLESNLDDGVKAAVEFMSALR